MVNGHSHDRQLLSILSDYNSYISTKFCIKNEIKHLYELCNWLEDLRSMSGYVWMQVAGEFVDIV